MKSPSSMKSFITLSFRINGNLNFLCCWFDWHWHVYMGFTTELGIILLQYETIKVEYMCVEITFNPYLVQYNVDGSITQLLYLIG